MNFKLNDLFKAQNQKLLLIFVILIGNVSFSKFLPFKPKQFCEMVAKLLQIRT